MKSAEPSSEHDLTGVRLTTPRLILRALRDEDIDAVTEACQDPEIQRYTMVPSPYRRADAEQFVRRVAPALRAAGTGAPFGVFTADTATLVGTVGLLEIGELDEPAGGRAGIGYWTAPAARRRGYTTEAVGAVCRWGFRELGLAVISWEAIVGNDGSWEVARRNGFVREGTRRARLLHRGVRRDLWVASLLPGDLGAPA
ncbi:GNAT family N-acetyltransferase [Actinocatenispora sera]|uniref:GNAT family N-acetyltransferase n=1 Tax=Actinocatenispora sera TaxID=390989 RepID=UPI0033EDAF4A